MYCANSNSLLLEAAARYWHLGYQIGATSSKVLIASDYRSLYTRSKKWDGISIVLDGIVCVDFDRFLNLDEYELPATLKERSPRGLHFFYRLPEGFAGTSKIAWRKNVDILTKQNRSIDYGPYQKFKGHVLCSPSKGYSRLSSSRTPKKADLPIAPQWILDAMEE
jgi:hypothetical protein